MRKVSVLLCVVLLSWVFARDSDAKMYLSIATGGEAGVYYPLGSAIAKLLTDHLADVEVTAKISNASAANISMIADQKAALALVQNDIAFRAVNGEKPFREPTENLTMIASLYPEHVQCVTIRGNGIKTLSDLRGKRVSVGTIESGTVDSIGAVLSAAEIKYAEINADFFDFTITASRMQDDQLDAGFVLAGYPTAAVTVLAAGKDIDLVAFEDDLMDKLSDSYPYFTRSLIPAGTYRGVDRDIPTIAVMALLVCDSNMPDDLVYDITRVIFENLAVLATAHPKAELISLDTALSSPVIKVHPGAVKYYSEKGLAVPVF